MNRTQIAAIYDSFTPEEQNMPREQFIKRAMDAMDPGKIAIEADRIAQGRIQKAVIDSAITRGKV